jgi:coenzyme F420-0:L-glutamate ligase/coenzyme F420-1:gamma-L-glutamate ligase
MSRVELVGVPGLPEVRPGDDLASMILAALSGAGLAPADGDILVVASKVVAKAEGRLVPAGDLVARQAVVDAETARVLAQRLTPRGVARIVRSRSGPVLAAAGVDASNLTDGGHVLALPADPDASARRLLAALRSLSGARVGVVITDTLGRPWRTGQVDAAIGAAGIVVSQDLAGQVDTAGRVLEVTDRALADEIASAADLVKAKVAGLPVALVRGLAHLVTESDGPGAAALLRPEHQDWFRYGHAEAARAALGVAPDAGLAVQPAAGGAVIEQLERAVAVALASEPDTQSSNVPRQGLSVAIAGTFDEPVSVMISVADHNPATWTRAGALAQRIVVAAWAEDLIATIEPPSADAPALIVRVRAPAAGE